MKKFFVAVGAVIAVVLGVIGIKELANRQKGWR